MKQITISLEELTNDNGDGGLEIIIPGSIGGREAHDDCPIFIEYYEGKIHVRIWDLTEEPIDIPLNDISELLKIRRFELKEMPMYINHENECIREVAEERLKTGE